MGIFMWVGAYRITKRFGLRYSLMVANMMIALCLASIPFISNIWSLMLVYCFGNSMKNLLAIGYIACLTNAVPPNHISKVNGVGVMFESVGKAAGPLGGATGYAWTISSWGRSGHSVIFVIMMLLHIVRMLGTGYLPGTVECSDDLGEGSSDSGSCEPCAEAIGNCSDDDDVI